MVDVGRGRAGAKARERNTMAVLFIRWFEIKS
eukprot:SAG31_NODE_47642_length_230_cov_126.343511_1_plen_31_part_10